MDGMQSTVGAALTFSYTPAEIQGLAEPAKPSNLGYASTHARTHARVYTASLSRLRRTFAYTSRSRGLVAL